MEKDATYLTIAKSGVVEGGHGEIKNRDKKVLQSLILERKIEKQINSVFHRKKKKMISLFTSHYMV